MSNTSFHFRYHRHWNPEEAFESDSDEDQDMDHQDDSEEKNKLIRSKNPEFKTNVNAFDNVSRISMVINCLDQGSISRKLCPTIALIVRLLLLFLVKQ